MVKTICWDTETGGFNPFKCGLCSITLKVIGENKIKTIYIKPNPRLDYHPAAMKVNGLTKLFLEENGVSELEAIAQIIAFVKSVGYRPVPLAHNIVFDAQFTNALFARNSKGSFMDLMHYHPMDTMILMKALKSAKLIDIGGVSLKACYKHFFGEDFQNAHTSEGDVLATEQVYLKILELLNTYKN